MDQAASNTPLTPRQLVRVYVAIGLAVAFLCNRWALPQWLLPEYRNTPTTLSQEARAIIQSGGLKHGGRVEFSGRSVLCFGDSMTRAADAGVTDVVSLHGADAAQLREQFSLLVGDRRYDTILLWPGTSHLRRMGSVDSYVEHTLALIADAQAHSNQVIILGPMPYGHVTDVPLLTYAYERLPRRIDWAAYRLRKSLRGSQYANVFFYDARAVRRAAILDDEYGQYFADSVHLREAGFARVLEQIDARLGGRLGFLLTYA